MIEEYGLYHISTGDLLRDHIRRDTELGRVANDYITKGQLIPDDLRIETRTNRETAKGVIFDGFPRTIEQAKALNKMLERRGSKVHAVVGLEVSEPELFDRLVKRGKESGRSDDNPETISNRLKVYHAQTSPLQEFYKTEGKYHGVKGEGTIDEIFQLIKKELEPTRPAE